MLNRVERHIIVKSHVNFHSRVNRDTFICTKWGVASHADINASYPSKLRLWYSSFSSKEFLLLDLMFLKNL